jgi:hypothetical protein
MENKKSQIGIKQIQNIKMNTEEKEHLLQNVLNASASDTKPIKSPYSFVSMFQGNNFAYFGVILLLLIVLGSGNMILNYSKNGNNQVAIIDNQGINSFTPNTSIPTVGINGNTKETNPLGSTTSPKSGGSVAQNNNDGRVSSSSPSPTAAMLAPTMGGVKANQEIYQGSEFSFNYDASAKLTSGTIPNYGYYVELSTVKETNTIHFYSSVLPDNFRPDFFKDTTVINGKTFYFGDVQTENGIERSYMYKKDGKTIVIQNDYLIDLGSIEIN